MKKTQLQLRGAALQDSLGKASEQEVTPYFSKDRFTSTKFKKENERLAKKHPLGKERSAKVAGGKKNDEEEHSGPKLFLVERNSHSSMGGMSPEFQSRPGTNAFQPQLNTPVNNKQEPVDFTDSAQKMNLSDQKTEKKRQIMQSSSNLEVEEFSMNKEGTLSIHDSLNKYDEQLLQEQNLTAQDLGSFAYNPMVENCQVYFYSNPQPAMRRQQEPTKKTIFQVEQPQRVPKKSDDNFQWQLRPPSTFDSNPSLIQPVSTGQYSPVFSPEQQAALIMLQKMQMANQQQPKQIEISNLESFASNLYSPKSQQTSAKNHSKSQSDPLQKSNFKSHHSYQVSQFNLNGPGLWQQHSNKNSVNPSQERALQIQEQALKFLHRQNTKFSESNSFKSSFDEQYAETPESSRLDSDSVPSSMSTGYFNQNLAAQMDNLQRQSQCSNPRVFSAQKCGLYSNGELEYQTFSEKEPVEMKRSEQQSVNQTGFGGYGLDLSKATPAFKKGTKDQLNSNATSNTITSNDQRFEDSQLKILSKSTKNLLSDTQKTEKLLSDIEEVKEEEIMNRKSIDSRQIQRKQPKAFKVFNVLRNESRNVGKRSHTQVEFRGSKVTKVISKDPSTKVVIEQNPTKSNVYTIYTQKAERPKNAVLYQEQRPAFTHSYKMSGQLNSRNKPASQGQHFISVNEMKGQRLESEDAFDSLGKKFMFPISESKHRHQQASSSSNQTGSNSDNQHLLISYPANPLYTNNGGFQGYQPIESQPTMIKKGQSSSSSSSSPSSQQMPPTNFLFQTSSPYYLQSQQFDAPIHQQSMDELSENQINEGVVYFQNGIGQPSPLYKQLAQPLSKQMMSSMVTASSSIFSNKLKGRRNLSNVQNLKNRRVHESYLNQPIPQGSRNLSQTSYKSLIPPQQRYNSVNRNNGPARMNALGRQSDQHRPQFGLSRQSQNFDFNPHHWLHTDNGKKAIRRINAVQNPHGSDSFLQNQMQQPQFFYNPNFSQAALDFLPESKQGAPAHKAIVKNAHAKKTKSSEMFKQLQSIGSDQQLVPLQTFIPISTINSKVKQSCSSNEGMHFFSTSNQTQTSTNKRNWQSEMEMMIQQQKQGKHIKVKKFRKNEEIQSPNLINTSQSGFSKGYLCCYSSKAQPQKDCSIF